MLQKAFPDRRDFGLAGVSRPVPRCRRPRLRRVAVREGERQRFARHDRAGAAADMAVRARAPARNRAPAPRDRRRCPAPAPRLVSCLRSSRRRARWYALTSRCPTLWCAIAPARCWLATRCGLQQRRGFGKARRCSCRLRASACRAARTHRSKRWRGCAKS